MAVSRARERAYENMFGTESEIFAHEDAEVPNIEVRRYRGTPATDGPVCDIWVTSGMSDRVMHDDDGAPLRRELIFYAEPDGDFAGAIRNVAIFPFEDDTFLDHCHTVQVYGSYFVPGGFEAMISVALAEVTLPHVVLLQTLLGDHQGLTEELVIRGTPVDFLWVVPISQAELELKKSQGVNALLDLFDENQHPWLFDPKRLSYV